jgi:hypothetical protein
MSDQIRNKKFSFLKGFLSGMGIFLLVCSGSLFLLWYMPLDPDPVSPPATQLGKEPAFDYLLASENEKWLFLFTRENKIMTTDIYGGNEKVVLDITTATDNVNSELLNRESISPDGRLLAVNYFNERDESGYWHPPVGKVIIFDLKNGTVKNIPISLDGFEFDWNSPVYWLSSDVILVKMHRFPGGTASSQEVRYLRYDLQNLESSQVIKFDPCSLTTTLKLDSRVLLLASDCDFVTQSTIYAIDIRGKRSATYDEFVYFNRYHTDCRWNESCIQNLSSRDGSRIKVEPVTGDVYDGYGKWYENNRFRNYLYIDNKLARVTDLGGDEIFWDSDLKLFVWSEIDYQYYYMDNQGHYRFWYDGKYIGKIPRSP